MFSMRGHNRPMSRPTIPGTDLSSPDVPTAIIYRPSRSATQSGPRRGTGYWSSSPPHPRRSSR